MTRLALLVATLPAILFLVSCADSRVTLDTQIADVEPTDGSNDAAFAGDLPLDVALDIEAVLADLQEPPMPCVPVGDFPAEAVFPTASVLPVQGALLSPMETIEIRFSEYMHPDSLSIGGTLEPGGTWWEPPYEVLLLEPPAGGWSTGGSIQVVATDRSCNPLLPLEVTYDGVAAARPVMELALRFFVTANDDGQQAAPLTEEIAALWLDEINLVYQPVDMHFQLVDDDEAWIEVNDTALNGLYALSEPAVHEAAVQLVAPYPDTLNIIFSWGPLPIPAQGGFTSPSLPFISATSFQETLLCGDLSRDVVPHEMGHYFGLPHTHQAEFWTVAEAQAAYDGAFLPWDDGFPDTPALPHISGQLCTPPQSLVLGGIPRTNVPGNLMNYDWTPHGALTWAQGGVARQTAAIRFARDLRNLVSPAANYFFEAEDLVPSTPEGWGIQENMGLFFGVWSGDAQRVWWSPPGSQSSLQVSVPEAGQYRLFVGFTMGPDFGIHKVGMNGQSGKEVNQYSTMVRHSQVLDLGTYALDAGANSLDVICQGAEASSLGTLLGLDYLLLRRE